MAESKSAPVEIKNTPDDISDIVSYYTKFAPTYDREIEVGKDYIAHEIIPVWILEHTSPNSLILDLGCGTGLTGEKLLKNGHRVVGVDLTPEMIVQLRMKQLAFTALLVGNCEDAHSSKTVAELQVTDTEAWPLLSDLKLQVPQLAINGPNGAFDACLLVGVMEFIRNPTLLFRRVALVLRKGGLFGLTCPKRSEDCNEPIDNRIDVYMRTESELAHAADMAGLEIVKFEEFLGFQSSTLGYIVKYLGFLLRKK